MADDGQRPAVSRPLVRILADMVEEAVKRDDRGRPQGLESVPKKSRRRDSEKRRPGP